MKTKGIIWPLLLALALTVPLLAASVCQATGFYQVEAGDEASAKGDLDGAINHYGKALKSGDLSSKVLAKTYIMRGMAWNSKGRRLKALADYSSAIKLDPNNAEALELRQQGWQAEIEAGDEAFRKNELDLAIRRYSRAIDSGALSSSTLAMTYFRRADVWYVKDEHYKAIADYSEAIKRDPSHALIYYSRAWCWIELFNVDKATDDLDQAIALEPTNALYYSHRGIAWLSSGYNQLAMADFNKAIELKPDDAMSYLFRGRAQYRMGRNREAIADYEKALEIDPVDASALSALAWILAACPDGQYRDGQKAVRLASQAVALDKREEYLDTLAAAQAETGDFQAAIKTQRQAIALLQKRRGDSEGKRQAKARLELYKQGKPLRDN